MPPDATPSDTMRSLSCADAAALLGVTRHTVHRWIVAGRLPAFDIGTPSRPRLRVTEAALREFIDASQIAQP